MTEYRKQEKKTYDRQLIEEALLSNQIYYYNKLEPSLFFWKELTATFSQTPSCLVPDTLILNDKDLQILWIYTDQLGHIRRQTNVNYKDFVAKITSYTSPNELVAILKRPIFSQKLTYTNDFKLLNSRYLLNSSQQQIGQKGQVFCIQRFIKSNGGKPFLCRTIYNRDSSSVSYLITNSRNFYDKNQIENKKFVVKPGDKSTIVKSKQGKALQQTQKYLKEIVKYLKIFRGIEITEIVGDFIKDQTGNWWLVNIKAFKVIEKIKKSGSKPKSAIRDATVPELLEKERYQKTKLCRYCQKSYLESQLRFKMTMRMIIEVDKYLQHLGKEYNWLKRSDISNIDSNILYQEHKVCVRCFKLYTEIQNLMQIESKFLTKQGCQLISPPNELIFSQTNQEHLRLQAKNKEIHRLQDGIPQIIELGPNTNITIKDSFPIKNDQIINKMMRFRFIVFLNQIDQVVNVNPQYHYYLQFVLFGKKHKYKLNMSLSHQKIIPLNKLKVFYFFAHSQQNLQKQCIASNASFKVHIITQHKESQQKKTIGQLSLLLKDFMTPVSGKKDFYKFFHIEKVAYGWGLQGSIGILPSESQVSTAKVSFDKSQGQIYIPNQNYYFCQPLAQEWIDLIKTKNQQVQNRRSMMKQTKMSTFSQKQKKCQNSSTIRHSTLQKSIISYNNNELSNAFNQISQNGEGGDENKNMQNSNEMSWEDMLKKQIMSYEEKGIKKYSKKSITVAKNHLYNLIL